MPPFCVNKGCGKEYSEVEGVQNSECNFHPGSPVFHDALKGYSCCSKKVTDFDAFMKIPGCSIGKHSNQKPLPPAKVEPIKAQVKEAPKPVAVKDSKVETFTAGDLDLTPKPKEIPKVPESEQHDQLNAEITSGTICKRPTCGTKYIDQSSRKEKCVHHEGVPVFHEGSKGWSCCKKRVFDFDEFLKLPGCKTAKHRFTNGGEVVVVECRQDWYQTPDRVILSIFAKKLNKSRCGVEFGAKNVKVDLEFMDGSVFKFHSELFQPIKPEESKFSVLSTKVEIVFIKANGISWAAIEPKSGVTNFTTFGIQGNTTGTVGSKEAVMRNDVPIELLQK
jgi:hypothetical protein